ncbi:MAG: hypothetical protein QOK17_26 [Sphingomonadales bacterium]|jgi:hypothetical protein|nr:hypothetical protein [Sphingomonadales bacterium]
MEPELADFLYATDGNPQGFRLGAHIYAMDGRPVGRVFAEKAYRLDGCYVGAVINNMVVDRPGVSRQSRPSAPLPAPVAPPRGAEHRRPVGETFPDCFALLAEAADQAA